MLSLVRSTLEASVGGGNGGGFTTLTVQGLGGRHFPKSDCADTRTNTGTTSEEVEDYALAKKPRFILALASKESSVRAILAALSDTVAECPDRISSGAYHASNGLAFYLYGNDTGHLQDLIFAERPVQTHRSVVVLREIMEAEALIVAQYNIYLGRHVHTRVVHGSGELLALDRLFATFPMQVFIKALTKKLFMYHKL